MAARPRDERPEVQSCGDANKHGSWQLAMATTIINDRLEGVAGNGRRSLRLLAVLALLFVVLVPTWSASALASSPAPPQDHQ